MTHTPSYLRPFLENQRTVFNLPFSDQPFGCFIAPFSSPDVDKIYRNKNVEAEKQISFFNYLDTKTILTREHVRDNWTNMVLIDGSVSGNTPTGASIFLNRYVGNIAIEAECIDIENAKPLKYIQLQNDYHVKTNIDPDVAQLIDIDEKYVNYNPALIVLLDQIIFYHIYNFFISHYPRYVPSYGAYSWDKDPYEDFADTQGRKNMELFKELYELYGEMKNENYDNIYRTVDILKELLVDKQFSDNKEQLVGEINGLFDEVNRELLYKKYNML